MSARSRFLVVSLALVISSMLMVLAVAQNSATENGTDAYARGLQDLLSQARATSLEIFLEDHPNSPLRKDALELLIWNYEQNHSPDSAAWTARRLLRTDPENPAALAVMAQGENLASSAKPRPAQDLKLTRALATRGLLALPSLNPPQGISAELFDTIKLEIKAMLDGALGMAALQSRDYLTAQIHLREAVQANPDDVQNLYSLALSYLLASPPNNSDGMWFLARVSNVAPAPLAGQADRQGRKLSRSLYGSEARWEGLLRQAQFESFPEPAAEGTLPAQNQPSAPAPSSGNGASADARNTAVLKIKAALLDANQVTHAVPRLVISVQRMDAGREAYLRTVATDSSGAVQLALPAGRYGIVTPRGVTSGQQWYTWNLEVAATDPHNYIELTAQNATVVDLGAAASPLRLTAAASQASPMFLGIVVDNSAAMAPSLSLVQNGLLPSLRQLRPGEETFVLNYGGRPRISQMLTSNPALVQRAIGRMTASGNAALYDGLIAAANYLRARAAHGDLALLIIAGGRDTASRGTLAEAADALRSLHASAYCIGMRDDDEKFHDALTRLASETGGQALFPRPANLTVVSRNVMERLQDRQRFSPPSPPAASAVTPASAAPSLHSYSAVTVKEFVVEDGPDTSGFHAGDEVLLQKLAVARMRKYTRFKKVVDGGEATAQGAPQSGDGLTLAGIVVAYDSGGRVRRNLIGTFGGVMTLTVRFVFRDARTGDEIFRTELTSKGGPVFFGGNTEEMRSQAMLRLADSLVTAINKAR